jgi:1-acyl-sn-glycerol-3-phosphate acyltransferase
VGVTGAREPATEHCLAMAGGKPCTSRPKLGLPYCARHLGPVRRRRKPTTAEAFEEWRESVRKVVDRRLKGEPPPGEYDQDLVRAILPFGLPFYSWYWRVDVEGVQNIPTEGPALLASNHSGTLPVDGAMLKIAVLKEHGRNPWLLAADLVFRFPVLRGLTKAAGNMRAGRDETVDLLRKGELVGVFPEGFKGIGKGWFKRYQLQRFGRGGFVEVALQTGSPIIPTAIIGAEEIYPMIYNVKSVARTFGLPYFPITPFFPLLGPLGAVPLPSKWLIAFGEPISVAHHGPEASDDLQLVLEITEEVRGIVQRMVAELLAKRRTTFW